MIPLILLGIILSSSRGVFSQHEQGRGGYYTPAPVAILNHKQALGQDGSFNYAFTAENGLQQGEVINPDGSRTGSYSYVDPNGKIISLKYTAGKDGFRVLEGDHVPKPPVPISQPNNYQPQQPPFIRGNIHQYNAPFRTAPTYRPAPTAYGRPQYSVDEGNDEGQSYSPHQYRAPFTPAIYSTAPSEIQLRNEPHSFGEGFSFEFSS